MNWLMIFLIVFLTQCCFNWRRNFLCHISRRGLCSVSLSLAVWPLQYMAHLIWSYALLDDRATVLEERQTVIFPLIIGFPVDNISPSSKSTLSGFPLDIAVTSVLIMALIWNLERLYICGCCCLVVWLVQAILSWTFQDPEPKKL